MEHIYITSTCIRIINHWNPILLSQWLLHPSPWIKCKKLVYYMTMSYKFCPLLFHQKPYSLWGAYGILWQEYYLAWWPNFFMQDLHSKTLLHKTWICLIDDKVNSLSPSQDLAFWWEPWERQPDTPLPFITSLTLWKDIVKWVSWINLNKGIKERSRLMAYLYGMVDMKGKNHQGKLCRQKGHVTGLVTWSVPSTIGSVKTNKFKQQKRQVDQSRRRVVIGPRRAESQTHHETWPLC